MPLILIGVLGYRDGASSAARIFVENTLFSFPILLEKAPIL